MSNNDFIENPAEMSKTLGEKKAEESKIRMSKGDYSYLLYGEMILFPILIGYSNKSWEMFAFYIIIDLIIFFNKKYGPLFLLTYAISWGFISYGLLTWILGNSSVADIVNIIISVIIGIGSLVLHIFAYKKHRERL